VTLLQRLPTIRAKLGSVIVFAVGMTILLAYLILGFGFGVFALGEHWWEVLLAGALAAGIALVIARWVARGMTQPLRDMHRRPGGWRPATTPSACTRARGTRSGSSRRPSTG